MKPVKMIELNHKERDAMGKALKIVHDVAKQAKTNELAVMQYFMDEKSESERFGYLTGVMHRISEIKEYAENEQRELAYLESHGQEYKCTSCGTYFWDSILHPSPDMTFPHYCPACGAKFSTRPLVGSQEGKEQDDEERSS